MDRTLTPNELKTLLQERPDALQLLDVRRKGDLEADLQQIPGAAWRDPEQVAAWSQTLDSGREIVVYCVRGGSVSNSVLDALREKNLPARYLEGGLAAWKQSGGAIEASPRR